MRILAFAVALVLSASAFADPVASLSNAGTTGPGTSVTFAQPTSCVRFELNYGGTGGEVDIEGSTDGTTFTRRARLPLDDAGLVQGGVCFDTKPAAGRPGTSAGPAQPAGQPVVAVRANLVSLSGASDVTVTIDK